MGREDREGPPPISQVGEVGSLVPTSHSKVVAPTHPRYSHIPCTMYTSTYMYIARSGDTVGDYIQRSLERWGVVSRDRVSCDGSQVRQEWSWY